jgi:predicted alpha/beta hydrolase
VAVGYELSRPVPVPIGAPPPDLSAQSVEFASRSGSSIHGWLSTAKAGRGAVLLLPGVRANRRSMVGCAQLLHAAGYSTLAIDFQATGESPGDAITFGWRERLDVLAAVEMLRRSLPGESIAIIGTSLGGAATLLAVPSSTCRLLFSKRCIRRSMWPSRTGAHAARCRGCWVRLRSDPGPSAV